MTKYEPLTRMLRGRRESRLPMSFEQIEHALGFTLPQSARRHRPWWANQTDTGHSQTRGWMDAGWRTSEVDMTNGRVVFVRELGADESMPQTLAAARSWTDHNSGSRRDVLSPAARRLLDDYTREADGDEQAALARAIHEAAVARRNRLIERAAACAPRVPDNSVDLVREDRDAR